MFINTHWWNNFNGIVIIYLLKWVKLCVLRGGISNVAPRWLHIRLPSADIASGTMLSFHRMCSTLYRYWDRNKTVELVCRRFSKTWEWTYYFVDEWLVIGSLCRTSPFDQVDEVARTQVRGNKLSGRTVRCSWTVYLKRTRAAATCYRAYCSVGTSNVHVYTKTKKKTKRSRADQWSQPGDVVK